VFVDSSVIVAILSDEDDAAKLSSQIDADVDAITSPFVIVEAGMRLTSKLAVEPEIAESRIRSLLMIGNVRIVDMGDSVATLALGAFKRFGKGRGHPAQLNLGDCLTYASAREHRVGILYKGNDFAQTDMAQ
jgi:ribonuclease VapC